MRLGLGLGTGLALGGAWTPAKATGFNSGVFVALSREQGKLWQDSGKTTAAVADGDLVRVATCPFSGVDFTAPSDATRPTLRNSGNYWWLEYDGTDDTFGRTVALNQPYWAYAVGLVLAASGTLFDGQTVNAGYCVRNGADPTTFGIRAGVTLNSSNTVTAANTVVAGGIFNGASSVIDLMGTYTTGNAGTTNLTAVTVGARAGSPANRSNRLYAYCCGTGVMPVAERDLLRAYLAARAP
jgi:hypothetical protein